MLSARFSDPTENPGVLIASSNAGFRRQVIDALPPAWRPVQEALGGAEALGKLESTDCRMLLLDRQLPDLDVEELAGMVRLRYPGVDVQTLDAHFAGNSFMGQEAAAAPITGIRTVGSTPMAGMVGASAEMELVYRAIRRVSPRDTTVLIMGETGTGKELVAQAIHRLSRRSEKPFVVINCAAIPETLLESELFGYVRGAFTGAAQTRQGRIQAAHGGTLFLDEIGDIPFELQAKLLRFLETGELQKLGSSESWKADVRIVAATNQNLRECVRSRRFREDLFYRLCVFPIHLPPLRGRREDIALLASYFLQVYNPGGEFSRAALKKLEAYEWPGNVRELKHAVERATINSSDVVLNEDALVLDPEAGAS